MERGHFTCASVGQHAFSAPELLEARHTFLRGLRRRKSLLVIPTWASPSVISDGSGATWKVSQIANGCALATVFTMGTFILLAWVRLRQLKEPLLEELTYLTTVEPPDSLSQRRRRGIA